MLPFNWCTVVTFVKTYVHCYCGNENVLTSCLIYYGFKLLTCMLKLIIKRNVTKTTSTENSTHRKHHVPSTKKKVNWSGTSEDGDHPHTQYSERKQNIIGGTCFFSKELDKPSDIQLQLVIVYRVLCCTKSSTNTTMDCKIGCLFQDLCSVCWIFKYKFLTTKLNTPVINTRSIDNKNLYFRLW